MSRVPADSGAAMYRSREDRYADLTGSHPFGRDAHRWLGTGKVRARKERTAVFLTVEGITTQARYYKPLIHEFFRKDMTMIRPRWGECWCVIRMEHGGEVPVLDLDNLAKALLDSVKRFVMHDDSQVGLLMVERRKIEDAAHHERICLALGFFVAEDENLP